MKYIEELEIGDSVEFEGSHYIITTDYTRNKDRMCVNLKTGCSKWFSSDTIVDISPIYCLDEDNNIVAIKPTEKDAN